MHPYDIHIKIEYEYGYLYLYFKRIRIRIIRMFSHPGPSSGVVGSRRFSSGPKSRCPADTAAAPRGAEPKAPEQEPEIDRVEWRG